MRHIKAPSRRSPREVQLLEGRHRLGDEYLVKLKGIGDRDSANRLRGSVLYARQTERPKDVADDEYLIADLVGLEVFLADGYGDDNNGDNEAADDSNETLAGKFVGRIGVLSWQKICVRCQVWAMICLKLSCREVGQEAPLGEMSLFSCRSFLISFRK